MRMRAVFGPAGGVRILPRAPHIAMAGVAFLSIGIGTGVAHAPGLTSVTVAALLATVAVAAIRPPVEWLLPGVPMAVPLAPLAYVRVGGATMPIVWADVATALVMLAWLARSEIPPRRWLRWVLVLVAWSTLSVFVADDVLGAVSALKVVVQAAFLGLVAAGTAARNGRGTLLAVSWGLLAMGVTTALRLLFQGAGASRQALVAAAASKVGTDLDFGRSNYLAALIVLSLSAAVVLWRHLGTGRGRMLVLAAVPLLLFGLVATGSKSQVLSVGVILACVVVVSALENSRPRRNRPLLILVGTVVLVSSLTLAAPFVGRMFEGVSAAGGIREYRTVDQRSEIWQAALDTVHDNPVAGVGLQNFTYAGGQYTMAHNTPLQVAAETGVVGLVLYLVTIGVALLGHRGAYRGTALLVATTLLVSGLAENTLRTREYDWAAWILLGAIVAVQGVEPLSAGHRP